MSSLAEQSRALLPKSLFADGAPQAIEPLARALMSVRGEASGVALARELLVRLDNASADDMRAFFRFLADDLKPDAANVAAAAERYLAKPSDDTLSALQRATYSPRREFFRRLNLAPGATAEIVALRSALLRAVKEDRSLRPVDEDLERLLTYWFNRGFLVLRRIDWQTPAAILEKIIAYEAVHEIKGWDDLRRRLDPADRRCYAFFHPSMVDEPLIFVEVALSRDIPGTIAELLAARAEDAPPAPTTAVFYSISNSQDGLKGISFGNFLIKQVVEDLKRDVPSLKTFVTLSPVPRFAAWLNATLDKGDAILIDDDERAALKTLTTANRIEDDAASNETLRTAVLALAAQYFLHAKSADGKPIDPVARFHLGNGARLERINWLGDTSAKGMSEAFGLMVNYLYDPKLIEENHEAFVQDGTIAAAKAVRALSRSDSRSQPLREVTSRVRLSARRSPAGDP